MYVSDTGSTCTPLLNVKHFMLATLYVYRSSHSISVCTGQRHSAETEVEQHKGGSVEVQNIVGFV